MKVVKKIFGFVIFSQFILSCSGSEVSLGEEFIPFPESEIKRLLGEKEVLSKIITYAKEKDLTVEELKNSVKTSLTETEISEALAHSASRPQHIESIERSREEMRIRLAWSKILYAVGVKAEFRQKEISLPGTEVPSVVSPSPKWIIVEWSDFNCPYCKKSFPSNEKILKKYKGKISWYYRSFPLNPDEGEGSKPLAISRCVWAKHKSQYKEAVWSLYEKEETSFENCQTEDDLRPFQNMVLKDYEVGKKQGVRNIPSYQVNGMWIVGAMNSNSWEKALKATALP